MFTNVWFTIARLVDIWNVCSDLEVFFLDDASVCVAGGAECCGGVGSVSRDNCWRWLWLRPGSGWRPLTSGPAPPGLATQQQQQPPATTTGHTTQATPPTTVNMATLVLWKLSCFCSVNLSFIKYCDDGTGNRHQRQQTYCLFCFFFICIFCGKQGDGRINGLNVWTCMKEVCVDFASNTLLSEIYVLMLCAISL